MSDDVAELLDTGSITENAFMNMFLFLLFILSYMPGEIWDKDRVL